MPGGNNGGNSVSGQPVIKGWSSEPSEDGVGVGRVRRRRLRLIGCSFGSSPPFVANVSSSAATLSLSSSPASITTDARRDSLAPSHNFLLQF